MRDPVKVTNEELKAAQDIQNKFQEMVVLFGNLYVEKMQIELAIKNTSTKESKLQTEWKTLQQTSDQFGDEMFKKYGDGTLDFVKGLFVPTK